MAPAERCNCHNLLATRCNATPSPCRTWIGSRRHPNSPAFIAKLSSTKSPLWDVTLTTQTLTSAEDYLPSVQKLLVTFSSISSHRNYLWPDLPASYHCQHCSNSNQCLQLNFLQVLPTTGVTIGEPTKADHSPTTKAIQPPFLTTTESCALYKPFYITRIHTISSRHRSEFHHESTLIRS